MEPDAGPVAPDTDRFAAVSALAEPQRRRLYELAATQPEGVTRDGAAAALGIARSVAAFHLEKLVAAGLLQADHRRAPGRAGPGAGRPAKWYRRAPGEVAVSVPERRYRLAAEVLADAAEEASGGVPMGEALRRAAHRRGARMGAALRHGAGGGAAGDATGGDAADRLIDALVAHGYEPRRAGAGGVWLANCPFDALAADHRQLVCAMNLDLLRGLLEAAGLPAGTATLDPGPGRCCVRLAA